MHSVSVTKPTFPLKAIAAVYKTGKIFY